MQEEQLRLQQLSEELELQTELAKANAEEHAYLEVEREEKTTSIFKNIEENARPSWPNDIPQYTPVDGQYYTQHDASFQPQAIAGADDFPHALRKSIHEREQPKSIQQNTPAMQMPSKDRKTNRIYGSAPTSTAGASTDPRGVANQMEKLLLQQRHTLALMLPQPEIPTFSGDPIEFQNFICAFENLIEFKTENDSARLYYLIQYMTGNVRELMRSCLSINEHNGYVEARRLLKQKYGQNYKIATAYVDRVTNGPSIKSEDGEALQKFSIFLTSCKNALKDIGYLSKIENPDRIRKIVNRLRFGLRRRWRDVADNITEKDEMEITRGYSRFRCKDGKNSCPPNLWQPGW